MNVVPRERALEIAAMLAHQWNVEFANVGEPVEELYHAEDLITVVNVVVAAVLPLIIAEVRRDIETSGKFKIIEICQYARSYPIFGTTCTEHVCRLDARDGHSWHHCRTENCLALYQSIQLKEEQ